MNAEMVSMLSLREEGSNVDMTVVSLSGVPGGTF